MKWLFDYHCTGDATASFLSNSVLPKETKLPEDSNEVNDKDSHVMIDTVADSQTRALVHSATDTLSVPSLTEKAKKKKTKSKKRSEKVEVGGGSTDDGISVAGVNSPAMQLPVIATDDSSSVGKRSKKIRHSGQVVRSEDVDGYCGSLPVDDLIEFIDCGRKLWQSRSRLDVGSLAEIEKLQSMKKESVRDAAVENDSGFGDADIPDRTDASRSDGAMSPSISSFSESVENVDDLLSDSLNPSTVQSTTEMTKEEHQFEIPANATCEWTVNSELSLAAAFLTDEELAQPEPEFTVVRQKKRRAKSQKSVAAEDPADKAGCHLMGSQSSSVVCSSASSERSNSPQTVTIVNEVTVSGRLEQPTSVTRSTPSRSNTTLLRRFNSEPKWQARQPRFHPSLYTSNELRSVHMQMCASGNPSARRWLSTSGGKCIQPAASLQRTEAKKMKDRKYNSSVDVSQETRLPDVVPFVERPQQAGGPCVSSKTKMQDAHCQTVDETVLQSLDTNSSVDTSQTRVPFNLLTLQLFMYHG